jgi:hypothetical protein
MSIKEALLRASSYEEYIELLWGRTYSLTLEVLGEHTLSPFKEIWNKNKVN